MDWKLELVPVPVTDVERAKRFYSEQMGFAVDHDMCVGDEARIVQLTPPGSGCSIVIGTGGGVVEVQPGSLQGLQLVVSDVAAARAQLVERGWRRAPSSTSKTARWPTAPAGRGTRSSTSAIRTATAGRCRRGLRGAERGGSGRWEAGGGVRSGCCPSAVATEPSAPERRPGTSPEPGLNRARLERGGARAAICGRSC